MKSHYMSRNKIEGTVNLDCIIQSEASERRDAHYSGRSFMELLKKIDVSFEPLGRRSVFDIIFVFIGICLYLNITFKPFEI